MTRAAQSGTVRRNAAVRPSAPHLAALESMPDAVIVCDSAGRITFANRRALVMTGYGAKQLLGRPVEILVATGYRSTHRERRLEYQARPQTRPMGTVDQDFEVRRRNGTTFTADIALGPMKAAAGVEIVAVVRDITARKNLELALAHQALHDPLTDLANRTLFFDRLRQAMFLARRDRKQVALVLLDLDHFKAVNDVHGHQAGDRVLKKVADNLKFGLRASDTVARVGGDEFAWVLPSISGRQAASIMLAKLLRAVPSRVVVAGASIEVGVSAGMALYPDDARDVDSLIRAADVELYAAKRQMPGAPTRRVRRR